jgi:hypothetical protein
MLPFVKFRKKNQNGSMDPQGRSVVEFGDDRTWASRALGWPEVQVDHLLATLVGDAPRRPTLKK